MPTLDQLKQKTQATTSAQTNGTTLTPLTQDQIRKIMPAKQPTNEPTMEDNILNDAMSALELDLNSRRAVVEEAEQAAIDAVQDEVDSKIFDLDIDAIEGGLYTEEESDKMISSVYKETLNERKTEEDSDKVIDNAIANVSADTASTDDFEDLLNDLGFDEDDEFDEEESIIKEDTGEDENQPDQKEIIKSMQTQIDSYIKPFTNTFDLRSFKISSKPKSFAKALEEAPVTMDTASWVLFNSKVPFTCSALGAIEIEKLDPSKLNAQNGRIDALRQMYGTLFKHYESPNKPKSLEEWLKTIPYADQDNLIFGYYKATFGQSNLMNYACEKCNEVKVKNVPIDNCVKYKDDETKKEVERILKTGDPTYRDETKASVIQVSDTLAVSIKHPSIYNVIFELGILDDDFKRKYADALGMVSYIENIYEIDARSAQLIPLKIKEDAKNLTKSVKRRLSAMIRTLQLLTPDQYNILVSEIAKFTANDNGITYVQPSHTCEKCGTVTEEIEMSAQEMLFTRHQLALIKSLPTE